MRRFLIALLFVLLPGGWAPTTGTFGQARVNVNQTTLEEPGQLTPESQPMS